MNFKNAFAIGQDVNYSLADAVLDHNRNTNICLRAAAEVYMALASHLPKKQASLKQQSSLVRTIQHWLTMEKFPTNEENKHKIFRLRPDAEGQDTKTLCITLSGSSLQVNAATLMVPVVGWKTVLSVDDAILSRKLTWPTSQAEKKVAAFRLGAKPSISRDFGAILNKPQNVF
ncbi:uncharacterized protein LY89DRAFT_181177 [Mollisia scopiformis]|uniref:Uncharacterized protein n=1 Tax=Mollisia scopiformis TaxID=149040 RepID=A0A194XSW8_MOLSC|nr:uncharacterized protein LY89DRAFT_181177 [Mollisia scopiformis]KUJ23400.1 hypothetical protein LY89DRAFT_181177 [Mollisia scopiformis]